MHVLYIGILSHRMTFQKQSLAYISGSCKVPSVSFVSYSVGYLLIVNIQLYAS